MYYWFDYKNCKSHIEKANNGVEVFNPRIVDLLNFKKIKILNHFLNKTMFLAKNDSEKSFIVMKQN